MTTVQPVNASVKENYYPGLIVGTANAGAAGVSVLALNSLAKTAENAKSLNASTLKSFAKTAPMAIGAGVLVDYLNNRQRANTEPNAVTEKGNKYTKVNNGTKFGALLGGLCGVINGVLNCNLFKDAAKFSKTGAAIGSFIGICSMAAGGYLLGSITDMLANKKAAKIADEKAANIKE